jgi:ribosomal protein L11 methyltransferase
MVVDPNAVSSDPFAERLVRPDAPRPTGSERCTVTGYLPVDDRLEAALDDIQSRLAILVECGLEVETELTLRTVDDEGWAEAWKSHFKPLRVGSHFVIKPSWESWDAASEDRIIEIDPGMAFGSGSHETTRLCLTLLEETVQPGERILDWGTGSGILSLGAACLGAREILAVDLDPVAVRVAAENVERNGLNDVIQTGVASIESVPADPPFDRVVANIVADPIIAGAAEIRAHLRPGGQAIVSGIIDLREAEVVSSLESAGLRLLRTLKDDDWRAFLFQAEE